MSCDQVTNLVLSDTIERIIREQGDDEPSSEQPHGLYLVRGDNVVVCGLVDEELDASIDWSKVRGDVIGSSTTHVQALEIRWRTTCVVMALPTGRHGKPD